MLDRDSTLLRVDVQVACRIFKHRHIEGGGVVCMYVCVGGEGRAMVFLIERISFYFVVGGWIEVSVTL